MDILQADQTHVEELAKLFDAYRVWYRMPSDLAGAKAFLHDRISTGESTTYFAHDPDMQVMVGFTNLYPLFSSTRMGRIWLLNDLFVDARHRGRGISKLLIDRAQKLARDTGALGILLETEKTNDIGNKLYPRTGFELETDTHYYFWKVDA